LGYSVIENNRINIPSEESTYLSRIVALENEELKITNGTVYVNNKKINPPYKALFTYKMNYNDFEKFKNEYNLKLTDPLQSIGKFVNVYMNDNQLEQIKKYLTLKYLIHQ